MTYFKDLYLGDYVAESTYDRKGRICALHSSFERTGEGKAWLAGQTIPITESERDGAWASLLVDGGGSVVVPITRLTRTTPFILENTWTVDYFGPTEEAVSVDVGKRLAELIDQEGLTFAQCLEAFHERQDDEADYFVQLARDEHEVEGEIEFDDNAITSGSDDKGDYVLAWIWVADPREDDDA